jgi:uncharacterized membrane protein YqhA
MNLCRLILLTFGSQQIPLDTGQSGLPASLYRATMNNRVMEPQHESTVKRPEEQSAPERVFEGALWSSRLIVLLAVVFGAASAIILFISGSLEILNTIGDSVSLSPVSIDHTELLIGIIGAVDFYLIAMVLLIFSFGIYELFISKLDIARNSKSFHTILEISTLDDLKNKIIKVIIMVLIVSFFQRVLSLTLSTSYDMLFMALSIAAICIGVFFLQKLKM